MKKMKLRFSKQYLQYYGEKLPLQGFQHILSEKYGITRGYRGNYQLLRMFDVIDEYNNPLPPYDVLRLFDIHLQDIYSPRGNHVADHNKLLVTLRGIVFIGRFLQQHADVKLRRIKNEQPRFMGDPIL
jgi:hypothetical protein